MRFSLLLIAVFFWSGVAFAQMPSRYNYFDYDHSLFADPLYANMVERAQSMPPGFAFGTLRRLYMQSSHYAPIGDDIEARLLADAASLEKSKDPQIIYKSLGEAQSILKTHAGHLGIVRIAENICRRDPRFGNPALYAWLRQGLMQDVLNSGDGTSPEQAYDVITLGEETALLHALHVEVGQVQTVQEGTRWYNMLTVTSKNGAPYTLFINATYPLSKIRKEQVEKPKPLDLFPQ